eukprot:Pgem_evm1s19478
MTNFTLFSWLIITFLLVLHSFGVAVNNTETTPIPTPPPAPDCRSADYYFDEGPTNNACDLTNSVGPHCDCDGKRTCFIRISFGSANYNR